MKKTSKLFSNANDNIRAAIVKHTLGQEMYNYFVTSKFLSKAGLGGKAEIRSFPSYDEKFGWYDSTKHHFIKFDNGREVSFNSHNGNGIDEARVVFFNANQNLSKSNGITANANTEDIIIKSIQETAAMESIATSVAQMPI